MQRYVPACRLKLTLELQKIIYETLMWPKIATFYACVLFVLCFDECFPGELGLAVSPWYLVFLFHLFCKGDFGWQTFFTDQMLSCHPINHCAEGNSKRWPQPGNITGNITFWPDSFLIHCRTPDGRDMAPNALALCLHYCTLFLYIFLHTNL